MNQTNPVLYRLHALTPIWTGGVSGQVDRIHETGILGSLRWWIEVLVRGLGGSACDPSVHTCLFDAERYRKSTATDERQRLRDARLCDVCQVFGATGWRRRFRLIIEEDEIWDASIQRRIEADRSYIDINGRTRRPTWYFHNPVRPNIPNTPKIGHFTICIQSLAQDFPAEVIAGLIQFIANWSALGARPQMGFGVVEPVNVHFDTRPLYNWLLGTAGSFTQPKLPSLRNIFLARVQLENATDQETFKLKYDLRRLFAHDRNLRHFIMGTSQGGRMAAKVKMSRPYSDGIMRVWGWVPKEANVYRNGWDREKVVQAIYDHLHNNYTLQVWREMNSLRDTIAPNNSDAVAFLQSLLAIEEED